MIWARNRQPLRWERRRGLTPTDEGLGPRHLRRLAPTGGYNALFAAGALAASNIADSIERSINLRGVTDFLVMDLPGFDLIPGLTGPTTDEADSVAVGLFQQSLFSTWCT